MNAFVLLLPLILIRFGLLGALNKEALRRAAHFAALEGGEKAAYIVYQAANAVMIFYPFFLKIQTTLSAFLAAVVMYVLGVGVLIISTVNFAKPRRNGMNADGIYRRSRNPMYVGYFLYYMGCVLFTGSALLLLCLLLFQAASHWIILAEERWCVNQFGEEYTGYMERVRRYL